MSAVVQSFTKECIQEVLGEDRVVTDAVLKMLTTCSEVRIDQFAPRKGVWGGSVEKGMLSGVKVTVQDRLAALARGFDVVLGKYARSGGGFSPGTA